MPTGTATLADPPSIFRRAALHAFTLTEILVVIIIIVLMLAMAIPVFRFITGSRSQAGASNQIAAFLGRCRNDAIGLQQTMGCAFYVDSTTGRTAMVEVEPVLPNAAPFDPNYNTAYSAGTYVSYNIGTAAAPNYNYYVAIKAVPPSFSGSGQPNIQQTNSVYWTEVTTYNGQQNSSQNSIFSTFLNLLYDRVPGTDVELLPSGVGVQLAIDDNRAQGGTGAAGTAPISDRYLHVGTVLFDLSGRLTSSAYAIFRGGPIGLANGFSTTAFNIAQNAGTLPGTATAATDDSPLYSSFGVLVYDRDALSSQNFPASDFITAGPSAPTVYGTAGSSPPSEADEENWLDTNGTPLLINRYTGTLLRSE